jgi:hypothetical protein
MKMVSQTIRIYQIEQLCRVVLALSQGNVIPDLSPARETQDTPRGAGFKATEGLFTSAIAQGKIGSWLTNPEEGMNY